MRRLLSLAAFAVAAAVTGSACGAVTPYAAIVNGERISQRELDRELRDIKANEQYLEALSGQFQVEGTAEGAFNAAFVARVLNRRIVLELVEQEVKDRKLEISALGRALAAEEVEAGFQQNEAMYRAFKQSYRDELVDRTANVNRLQEALAGVDVTEATLTDYYEANLAQFSQTCVSHILVETPEAAGAIKARIDGGEEFAAVANAESKDPGSAAQGGALGCVAPGSFVPEFETAMESLPEGQVSDPIQTQFGSHLILVTERSAQPLGDVRTQIRQALVTDAQVAFNELVTELLDEADVTVNPRYGSFRRGEGGAEVVPPEAPATTTTVAEGSVTEAPPIVPAPDEGGAGDADEAGETGETGETSETGETGETGTTDTSAGG